MEKSKQFQKAKLSYSYPSNQKRQGPAPLASFEDLPFDEQFSCDEDNYHPQEVTLDENSYESVLNLDCKEIFKRPHKDTKSPNISIKDEPKFHETRSLTPVLSSARNGYSDSQTSSSPRSQFSKSSGNFLSIPNIDDQNQVSSPNTKRKGSWTDLLFRGRSRSKSPAGSDCSQKNINFDETSKTKKGFFSLFKIRRKSSTITTSDYQNQNCDTYDEQTPNSPFETSTPRFSITDASEEGLRSELAFDQDENEPKESEQDILEIVEKEMSNQSDLEPKSVFDSILKRKLKSKHDQETIDDECRSLPERLPSSWKEKDGIIYSKNDNTIVVTVEHHEKDNSFESELDSDDSKSNILKDRIVYLKSQASDDVEATNLLIQDSIDYDDYCSNELQFSNSNSVNTKMQSKNLIKRDRLDLNTISIERPRSTTPINMAPLEAFIKTIPLSDQNSEQTKGSKIHLVLPCEQFSNNARVKSSRKSNAQILLDFCEKGLLNQRRLSANNSFGDRGKQSSLDPSNLNPGKSELDAFVPISDNLSQDLPLTPITPLEFEESWNPFGDEFDPTLIKNEHQVNLLKEECTKCSCLQNVENNLNMMPSNGSSSEDVNFNFNECFEEPDQTLLSSKCCKCDCHSTYWRRLSLQRQDPVFSSFSDISSASSRLIQDSSISASSSSSRDSSAKGSFEELKNK